jgi:hypothetical protein
VLLVADSDQSRASRVIHLPASRFRAARPRSNRRGIGFILNARIITTSRVFVTVRWCAGMLVTLARRGHLRTPTKGPAEHGGDMDLGLAERTALVCASTSGLGLATARALCEDGAKVVVTSRSSERAEEVAAALSNAIGIGCDLLATGGAARLFGESTKRVGKIDILVLNGPGPAPGTAAGVDDAGVDSAVAALVKPQVQLVRSVLTAMQAQRWGAF